MAVVCSCHTSSRKEGVWCHIITFVYTLLPRVLQEMVGACLLGAATVVYPCLLQAYHAAKDGSRRIQEALTTDDIRYIAWRMEKKFKPLMTRATWCNEHRRQLQRRDSTLSTQSRPV